MAAIRVLLIGLATDAACAAASERNAARLRRRGYEADVCGVDGGATAPDTLLAMMRAKPYDGIVFGADIRLDARHTRLFERLVNLAQVTKPDTVVMFDTGPHDTVDTVRLWFPSADDGRGSLAERESAICL